MPALIVSQLGIYFEVIGRYDEHCREPHPGFLVSSITEADDETESDESSRLRWGTACLAHGFSISRDLTDKIRPTGDQSDALPDRCAWESTKAPPSL